mmetsp:Transcript_17416/g.21370  ORF Transcript_17416/g.21370 Transcript_17416/m.21370 type:complete len:94 (-) Transcript_17416:188-469(-)
MMKRYAFIFLFVLPLVCTAFMSPSARVDCRLAKPRTFCPQIATIIVSAQKGKEVNEGPNYGEIAIMFINPLNPYSWFLYLFAAIIVLGNLPPP